MSNTNTLGGEPVFVGTRVSVRRVGMLLLRGVPMVQMREDFPRLAEVRTCRRRSSRRGRSCPTENDFSDRRAVLDRHGSANSSAYRVNRARARARERHEVRSLFRRPASPRWGRNGSTTPGPPSVAPVRGGWT
ncbi:MAG: DUF433 domain-containing protein [Deltaproteobacteria bacterium]|nr:DUF433 domain-containing protein [Deltaproteobacteria bacterium]